MRSSPRAVTSRRIPELRAAIEAEPLREGAYVRLMLASYRAGRQADALDVYQRARSVLRAALGVEPGPELEAMQRAVLAHDPALRPTSGTITTATSDAASGRRPASRAIREIVVTALDGPGLDVAIGSTIDLVRDGDRGAILTRLTEPDPDALETAVGALRDHRDRLRAQGIETRTAAFTSRDWGADIARLAARSSADLVVVGVTGLTRAGPLERPLSDLLGQAAADVALAIAPDRRPVDRRPVDAPIVVPFGGTAHDWAALELGAWLARARRTGLVVAGPFIQASDDVPRDASRLLADACLVVQRMLGVDAAPRLVAPSAAALITAADGASHVVLAISDRWRDEGLGAFRQDVADGAAAAVLVARRGVRPGGMAGSGSMTRFRWSIGG